MFTQRVGQRIRPPQKHPAVPEVVPCIQKLPGLGEVWLLREAADAERSVCFCCARLDIAISGLGTSGADAKDDDVRSSSRDLDALAQRGAVLIGIGDDVVGWKKAEHSVRIVPQQEKRREADGGRGIASDR